MRIPAYMRNVLMKYVDNLIAWGDQLFRQDTLETINQATLIYVLAGNILGKRQETVPPRASVKKYSFDGLMHLEPQEIDPFSNIKAEIESYFSTSGPPDGGTENNGLMTLFCIPKNDQLLSYWDTVADRLFKIRHCEN